MPRRGPHGGVFIFMIGGSGRAQNCLAQSWAAAVLVKELDAKPLSPEFFGQRLAAQDKSVQIGQRYWPIAVTDVRCLVVLEVSLNQI